MNIDIDGNFIEFDSKDSIFNIDKFLYNIDTNNTSDIFTKANIYVRLLQYNNNNNTDITSKTYPYNLLTDFEEIYKI